jgi:CRISPR-associated protein Csb2
LFAIHIRYLTGRVAAAEAADRDTAEWPPHPARLFMALAAAHFEAGGDPGERAALEWLEGLPGAPEIRAGEHFPRHAVTHYVPVNDKPVGEKPGPLQCLPGWRRNRQPRTFATAALEDEVAVLSWPHADAGPHLAPLANLCARVTRVGHAMSLVSVWASESAPGGTPSLVPNSDAPAAMLRVPGAGLLAELERRYDGKRLDRWGALKLAEANGASRPERTAAKKALKAEFPDSEPAPVRLRPMASSYQGYAPPAPANAPAAPGTVWGPALIVMALHRESGPVRHLDIAAALQLAGRLRDALLAHLGPGAPEVLSGHKGAGPAEDPHLAVFALPFVGHEHADGRLLGVSLAPPRHLAPGDRRRLDAAVRALRSQGLKLGPLGTWGLSPAGGFAPQRTLRPETWTAMPGGATEWATVTPYVCDRHAKAKEEAAYYAELSAEIAAACRRVLLDPGVGVAVGVSAVSAFPGAPPAHAFPRLRRKDGSQRRQSHAILTFDRPVVGPLLIGAGRFRGYGLCRPLRREGGR